MYFANAEHFTETMWDNGETFAWNDGKGDLTWVGSPTSNMVFTQALVWANKRSKSRKIASLSNHTWLIVDDPIATGVITTKNIPNVGAIMGYWIFITDLRGIHKVPAGRLQTLTGIRGLVGEITDKTSLRDLANAGLNCISDLSGVMTVRSARTMSKLPEWRFANALAMVTFFKRTFEQSFQDLENETSSAALFNKVYKLMYDFSQVIYAGSTNGGQESGYASFIKAGGSASGFDDVVKIVVDESINTSARIKDGELRANYYFMAPTPAERILVGVGLIYSVA
jgi:phage tail sheath protein FI